MSYAAGEHKAPEAFRTISEVAQNLDVPQHVLRFWESKFHQVRPLKRAGGRRYYRPEDVKLLSNIKELLYKEGFTIKGVQKLLKETGRYGIVRPSQQKALVEGQKTEATVDSVPAIAPVIAAATLSAPSMGLTSAARRELEMVLTELRAMRTLLRLGGI
ncbi:MAG: MerR family transcriptional regulator [Bdellovibrionales bacterium]